MSRSFVIPCKYVGLGCTRTSTLETQEIHEMECCYGPHKCPFLNIEHIKCNWEGAATKLDQHIINQHKNHYTAIVRSRNGSTYCPNFVNFIDGGSWYQIMFTVIDKTFFFYSKITDNILYMCYMYVGPRGSSNYYKYTIEIKTTDGRQSFASTLQCPHYQEFIDGKLPNEKCALLPKEFAKQCLSEDGKLIHEYRICIN